MMSKRIRIVHVTFAAMLVLVAGCRAQSDQESQRPLKIAVAHFSHEATTFSPEKAGIDDFSKPNPKGESLLALEGTIEGFVKVAREHSGVTLVGLESFGTVIGGSSKGWITNEAYEHYTGLILRDLEANMPVDAVYLALHGAAGVEGVPRPEAELAKRVREIVGPDVPIAGTFDPHGNEDEEFLRYANFTLTEKYFPHYDARLQGERAARLLIRTARGDYKPTTATRKPGIITPTLLQWTGQDPWIKIVQRSLVWEAREKDVYISHFFGFPWTDVPDVGATFEVMTNNDQELADRIADDMADYMWRLRYELFSTEILQPKEAVQRAIAATRANETPIVLADYSDRPGDATHILRQVVDLGLGGVIVATLRDEHALAALAEAGAKAGDAFDREVGGFVISPDSGEPVRIQGEVVFFGVPEGSSGDENTAVIEFGSGNYLVITPHINQVMDPEEMRWGPIQPERFTTWVIKSRAHFRRGFDDNGFAKTIMIVDAPGPYLGTIHLDALPYQNVDITKLFPYSEGGLDAFRRSATR